VEDVLLHERGHADERPAVPAQRDRVVAAHGDDGLGWVASCVEERGDLERPRLMLRQRERAERVRREASIERHDVDLARRARRGVRGQGQEQHGGEDQEPSKHWGTPFVRVINYPTTSCETCQAAALTGPAGTRRWSTHR